MLPRINFGVALEGYAPPAIIYVVKIAMTSEAAMKTFGERLGSLLNGGEVIQLVGDVGAGKTTLTKGIASGLGIDEPVQSPTFTISRLYDARDDLMLAHYDFYRLNEPGIMSLELAESVDDESRITVLEWADIVENVLPADHLTVSIVPASETARNLSLQAHGAKSEALLEGLQ